MTTREAQAPSISYAPVDQLPFFENAAKATRLGTALIVLGVLLLAGTSVGGYLFHANPMMEPHYHYLFLTLIGVGGAGLSALAIYVGVRLKVARYDKDVYYVGDRKDEFMNYFRNSVKNPLFKLSKTCEKFPEHFKKGYVKVSHINELLKEIVFSQDRASQESLDFLTKDTERYLNLKSQIMRGVPHTSDPNGIWVQIIQPQPSE